MADDILDEPKDDEKDKNYEQSDIFLWANNLVQIKEDLNIEVFLFNKNYVVYKTQVSPQLRGSLEPLLLDNLLEFVLAGADEGLVVRGFEEGEAEENVLQRVRLSKVDNARMVLNWLKTQEHEIEVFVEEEHDFKRLKGVLARCTHKTLDKPFYIIKSLPSNMVMKGNTAWLMRGGKFVPFDAEGSLRIPPDNQLLVLDQDIFVFNQAKLETLFGYNAKKYDIAEKKIKELSERFKLSLSPDQTIEEMVKGKKALVNKLQKLEPGEIKQEELIDHAEEVGVELMTDETGAIIIMDSKDLSTFVNLLNDDYMESNLTGQRYEIKSKRPLKPAEEQDILKEVLQP